MKWVTRSHPHVDRAASAWLIRRFIDPEPEFLFVDDVDDLPAGATAFDIPGAEFSHHGGHCTFEVLARRHGIDDPGVAAIGRMVHEADIEDERFDAPEAAGLDAVIRGLGLVLEDRELLDFTATIFDGLLEHAATSQATGDVVIP